MSRRSPYRTPVPLILVLLACSEEPTAPGGIDLSSSQDLAFTFTHVDPALLIDSEHVTLEPTAVGPAMADEWGETLPASASIRDARTTVGFAGSHAYAYGEHRYTGNKGRIETTVEAAFMDQHLGQRRAVRQQSGLFLFDGGTLKHIFVIARLYTDEQCGLDVHGRSMHSAWWEFFQGTGAPEWGDVHASSAANPYQQPRCGRRSSRSDPTGSYQEGDGLSCTYLITYDLDTGEIYDVSLLYCGSMTLL